MLFCSLVYAQEETILLGRDRLWNDILETEDIRYETGKRGFLDMILADAEYGVDEITDMLFLFFFFPDSDASGHYEAKFYDGEVSKDVKVFGTGSAAFRKENGGITLIPRQGSLFRGGTEWKDFSIEFWLYPAHIQEGETIVLWKGSLWKGETIIPQELRIGIENNKVVVVFKNMFLPVSKNEHTIILRGKKTLVPRTWQHHLIRFESTIGACEYLVNGVPEDITYASNTGREDGSVLLPYIGNAVQGEFLLAPSYTGFIDEFRIVRGFVERPNLKRYNFRIGKAISKKIDLGYANTQIVRIDSVSKLPGDTDIYYYYQVADTRSAISSNEDAWKPFIPGKPFPSDVRGRFIQLKIELLPDGRGQESPALSELRITYKADLPPSPPSGLVAIPGDREIKLQWKAVKEEDVKGYRVYYGDEPGQYFGTESSLGPSPIDVGNEVSVTIQGLQNGKLYYFVVVAYDAGPHVSMFSREISARPSRLSR